MCEHARVGGLEGWRGGGSHLLRPPPSKLMAGLNIFRIPKGGSEFFDTNLQLGKWGYDFFDVLCLPNFTFIPWKRFQVEGVWSETFEGCDHGESPPPPSRSCLYEARYLV